MLIIQIALGIVLAVILLAFLPQILSISIWVALAAVGIGVIGAVIYFFTQEPIVFLLIVGVPIGALFAYKIYSAEAQQRFRLALSLLPITTIICGLIVLFFFSGEPLALVVVIVIFSCGYLLYRDTSINDKAAEKNRRKMLGYDD
jgi:hypothetical protein